MSITQSATDQLILEQHDRVLLIKLNRPDRLNAISRAMLDELSAKVVAADKDPEIRCIVLTGEGKGFCAGLDLIDTNKRREDEQDGGDTSNHNRPPRKLFDLRDAPINVMWHCDTPIICAINGAAAGYGMDLTLLCDMRIMSEHGKMAAITARRNGARKRRHMVATTIGGLGKICRTVLSRKNRPGRRMPRTRLGECCGATR